MTPEAQQIAIAEAIGRPESASPLWGGHGTNPKFRDYLNDLNAMYEAEKVGLVDTNLRASYQEILAAGNITDENKAGEWFLIHATAAQRAEAFLKTIGKWV